MQRPSILDAFNEAARFSNNVFGYTTEKLKEKNELQFNHEMSKLNTDIEDYVRDNKFVGGVDGVSDTEAYNKYLGNLYGFIKGRFGIALAENSSNYYKEKIINAQNEAVENARNYSLEKADQWRFQRTEVNYRNEINKLNNTETDTKEKLGKMMIAYEAHADYMRWNPETRAKELGNLVNHVFDQELKLNINNYRNVDDALEGLKIKLSDLSLFADEKGGAEGMLDTWITNKNERIEAAEGVITKAIHDREYNILRTEHETWQRKAYDAIRTGDLRGLIEAQTERERGIIKRDNAKNSNNYNPAHKPVIAGMYEAMPGLYPDSSGGGRKENIENDLKSLLNETIIATKQGYLESPDERKIPYQMKEVWENIVNDYLKERGLGNYTGRYDQMKRDYPIAGIFIETLINNLKKDPEYNEIIDAIAPVNSFIKGMTKDDRFFSKLPDWQKIMLEKEAENIVWDVVCAKDLKNTNMQDIVNEVQNKLGKLNGQLLGIFKIDPITGKSDFKADAGRDGRDQTSFMAKALYGLDGAIYTDLQHRERSITGVDSRNIEELKTGHKSELVREFKNMGKKYEGYSLNDITSVEFEKTPDGYDITNKLIFTLKDDPTKKIRATAYEHNSKYEMLYEEKDGNGWKSIGGEAVRRQRREEANKTDNRNSYLAVNLSVLNLPMPNDFTGSFNDITSYIHRDPEKYIEFLKEHYNGKLPEKVLKVLNNSMEMIK